MKPLESFISGKNAITKKTMSFFIAAMNPDELPIQELKENGLEDVFAANNHEIVFKYGACSNMDWLIVESPFMWHKDCAADQIKKALYVQTITMDKIVEKIENANPI